MNSAASATVLVSGPNTDVQPYSHDGACCSFGMRPHDVLSPNAPVKLAGMRIDPPPSLPVTSGRTHAASTDAEPPLDPPGVRVRSQGERVTPYTRFFVNAGAPNSGAFVLPTTIAPAARSRATWKPSAAATRSLKRREPSDEIIPAMS